MRRTLVFSEHSLNGNLQALLINSKSLSLNAIRWMIEHVFW